MIRPLIGLLGLLAALFPDRMVDIFESLAIENPEECTTTSWIDSGIRVEGIVVTAASLLGGRAYAWMMNLTGAFGAVILLFPRLYQKIATGLLYEHSADVEWNDRFTDSVRFIGALYLLLAIRSFRKRRNSN
ncbi:hypothetical protein OB919_02845 [Halobacteria archaeon AArc-curdl1]|uniref:Uncharacterized protein n=1 Tax=Natronosalvus hydrolyticus TaxID=2979988 RepID=A0AAP3E4X6_9EURY|nr:hypothetical protein [Halobacteria archaeon AArc-curdl1]